VISPLLLNEEDWIKIIVRTSNFAEETIVA
jgi:hypothetical protein